ncbi:MAG: hypothetical protein QOE08_1106 [Thermoleophilaceae bacterium]|nr:hypothetical protein [Thermoleophilaceae bacterium]
MAHRGDAKRAAREERESREREAAAGEARRRRLGLLAAAVAVAVVIVAVAVILSSGGGQKKPAGGGGSSAADALFAGIPQRGTELGSAAAPVTIYEYADLQCPFCADFANTTLPGIVTRYVRPGRVRLVFRNLTFLGPDSVRAAQAAGAAGLQNRLWNFVDVFYSEQLQENTGYVTDAFLRGIGGQVSGLNVAKMMGARADPTVRAQIVAARAEAKAAGVNSTPSFTIARGSAKPVALNAQSAGEFASAIDAALAGR